MYNLDKQLVKINITFVKRHVLQKKLKKYLYITTFRCDVEAREKNKLEIVNLDDDSSSNSHGIQNFSAFMKYIALYFFLFIIIDHVYLN